MVKYNTEEYEELREELKISHGFDRGIDYDDIKKKLIEKFNQLTKELKDKVFKNKSSSRFLHNKIIYVITSLIQLKNSCRIIESCAAIKVFFNKGKFDERIIVKIAKSECPKKKKDTGEEYITPRRNREIAFPSNWIDFQLTNDFKVYLNMISIRKLKQRVLMYLLREFNSNTHSLRYATINHLLYKRKIEMGLVAKFVGHVNVNQLVRYSQQKNADKIFDIDD